MPALLTKAGEILELDLLPITADAAGVLLPQVRDEQHEERARVVTAAYTRGEITREELDRACQQVVTQRFDHRVLAMLSKRIPEIDTLRRRVEGEPRLRVKP